MIFILRLLASGMAACALVSASHALTITFSDLEAPARLGTALAKLSGSTTYQSVFDISNNGVGSDGKSYKLSDFAPGQLKLKSFTAEFWFADDSDTESEKVNVYLGGTGSSWMIFENERVYGNHSAPTASYDSIFREFNYTNPSDLSFLDALQDGVVSFKVKASKGDTYLKQGKIVATFCIDDPVSVPESGSALLLYSAAMTALATVRRRFRRGPAPTV